MPGDGVDLLGEDSMQHAPQKDVKVAKQEEEHGHFFGRIWEEKKVEKNLTNLRKILIFSYISSFHVF